jgi:rod shape-determining protein MreC
MPPPRSRRTGQSRRAQYGRFISYVVAIGGVVIALLLLLLSVIDPRGFSAIKGGALDATTPISSAGRSVLRSATDFGQSIGDYFEAGRQNGELRDQLRTAEAKLTQAQAAGLENQRLRQLLQLRDSTADQVATGRIVSSSWEGQRRYAVLSVGSSQGVAYNMPVRAPEGLIGRVVDVGRWGARVLLIVDGASTVPGPRRARRHAALAVGTARASCGSRRIEVGVHAVPARRHAGHLRRRRHLPARRAGGRSGAHRGRARSRRPLASPARVDYAIVQPLFQPRPCPSARAAPRPSPAPGPAHEPDRRLPRRRPLSRVEAPLRPCRDDVARDPARACSRWW